MSGTCEHIKDLLAPWVRGELEDDQRVAVERHVADCADCPEEVDLIAALREGAITVPEGLGERVRATVADMPIAARSWSRPGWAVAAAAVVALGTAFLWQRRPQEAAFVEEPIALTWPSEDGVIAGVAMLDDLSDEALAELLEELGG